MFLLCLFESSTSPFLEGFGALSTARGSLDVLEGGCKSAAFAAVAACHMDGQRCAHAANGRVATPQTSGRGHPLTAGHYPSPASFLSSGVPQPDRRRNNGATDEWRAV